MTNNCHDEVLSGKTRYWVVIPAAGVGSRMQTNTPKQYLSLSGKLVIEYALRPFLEWGMAEGVVVATAPGDHFWPGLGVASHSKVHRVAGGKERCHSVLHALYYLASIAAHPNDWVLVHDAARPCLLQCDLRSFVTALSEHELGGVLGVLARDTIKHARADATIIKTVERRGLWHALTPQMFRLGALTNALEKAISSQKFPTDESEAMELKGFLPQMVAGNSSNIKITNPGDLRLAEFLLKNS